MNLRYSFLSISFFGLCSVSLVDAARTIFGKVQRKVSGVSTAVAATISCYDEDDLDADDLMVTGSTTTGSFSLTYQKKTNSFWSPCGGWDCAGSGGNPDIFCYVKQGSSTSPSIFPYRTAVTQEVNQDYDLNMNTITVYPDRRQTWCANTCGPSGIDMLVPDFEFTEECKQHDCCYLDCAETQSNCDSEFYDLMLSRCREVYADSSLTTACYLRAHGIYSLVVALGANHFGCKKRELDEDMVGDEEPEKNPVVPERFPEDDGYVILVDKRSKVIKIIVIVGTVLLFVMVAASLCIRRSYKKTAGAETMDKDTETIANEEM